MRLLSPAHTPAAQPYPPRAGRAKQRPKLPRATALRCQAPVLGSFLEGENGRALQPLASLGLQQLQATTETRREEDEGSHQRAVQ